MGYFVRKSAKGFRVIEQTWTPKRNESVVPTQAYSTLGFRPDMSLIEAKLRASQLNKQNIIESRKIIAVAKRIQDDKETQSAYLPQILTEGFEAELKENYADNPERLDNLSKQWTTVKKIITELAVDTKNFYAERQRFFNYYKSKKWSPDYIKKLNRLLNLYGQYVAKKTGSYYQDIPKLSPIIREKIIELRDNTPGLKTAADPLEWLDLKNKKSTFEHESLLNQWNWLFIGLWFGLRPKEIDSLKNKNTWRIETDRFHKIEVLHVYQAKLTSVSKDKRWKPIPVYLDEQKEALRVLKTGQFKRPLNKTLKRFFDWKIETYSPRKGFTDLMLERGFDLEDISIFLGHADISMTWKHYKNKMAFKLPG